MPRIERENRKAALLIQFLSAPRTGELHFFVGQVFEWCRELKKNPALNHPINGILGNFPFVARFDYKGNLGWLPAPIQDQALQQASASLGGKELGSIGPVVALKLILDMYEDGTLDRIRHCVCGKWFYAANNKKSSCSDACRFEKFKQEHPNFKIERRKYMRKLRNSKREAERTRRAAAAARNGKQS